MVHETLLTRLNTSEAVKKEKKLIEKQLRTGQVTPTIAAERILKAFDTGETTDSQLSKRE